MRFEFTLTCREMPGERAAKIFHGCHFAVQLTYLLTSTDRELSGILQHHPIASRARSNAKHQHSHRRVSQLPLFETPFVPSHYLTLQKYRPWSQVQSQAELLRQLRLVG